MSRKQTAAAVLVFACALAAPQRAFGSQPEHIRLESPEPFEVGPFPAGTFCDFTFQAVIFDEVVNVIRFLDDAGALRREIVHSAFSVVHTNADTGVALEERVHFTVHRDFVTGEETSTGNSWHLRGVTDGHHVFTGSGRYVVDMDTGEILEATPSSYPEITTICIVLGGAPAP